MATENYLWGAPRIHGELLKLGFTVSERTVSRYLPDRRTRRSQTWRTFFANHVGNRTFTAAATSSFATSDDDVDASVLLFRPVPLSREARYASTQRALVDWPPFRQSTSHGWCVAQDQLRRRTRFSSGKDPPQSWAVEPVPARKGWGFLTSRHSISPEGANQPSQTQRLGRFVRNQVVHRRRADTAFAPGVETHVISLSEYWRGTTCRTRRTLAGSTASYFETANPSIWTSRR